MQQELFLEADSTTAPIDQQEDFEDLRLPDKWYFGATLWSTDWTCETIVKQLTRGNISLSPRFQRRQAWQAERQSAFIESLILGLPIPQLILAEDKNKRGSFIVIDGKQRLLTLRQFTLPEGDDSGFDPLKLRGLADRPDLNGHTLVSMSKEAALQEDVNAFENQTIRTIVIRNWEDDLYLHSVFLRINMGSVPLSSQELRQALKPGPFSDFLDDYSVSSKELQSALNLKRPDFRMRDTELALRFFAYHFFADLYTGNLKEFLDRAVENLNNDWENQKVAIVNAGAMMLRGLDAVRLVFGQKAELRKWNGQNYERRINRAVFDIMLFYLDDEKNIDDFVAHGEEIEAEFRRLCEEDRDFLNSIESTTKSQESNHIRFSTWASSLSKILGREIKSPL